MLERELAAMQWKIRWEELDGDELRIKEKKKKRARKPNQSNISGYSQIEATEALLHSTSRNSLNSDKVITFCFIFLT